MSNEKKADLNHAAPVNTRMPGIIKPPCVKTPKVKVTGPGAETPKQPDAPKPQPTPAPAK